MKKHVRTLQPVSRIGIAAIKNVLGGEIDPKEMKMK
jgi:hypothetical protein